MWKVKNIVNNRGGFLEPASCFIVVFIMFAYYLPPSA